MISSTKRRFLTAALAAGALFGAGAVQAQSGQPPIKLGMLFGFTGPAAAGAANFKIVTELAVKEINDAGGLLGRRIELVQADHGFDPTRVVNEARRLLQQEKVDVVFGPEGSALAIAAAPIFNEAKVPYFSTTVTAAPTKYNFTSLMSGLTQATAGLNFAAKELKAKTVAIISDNGGLGKELAANAQKIAPTLGLKVVSVQEFQVGATDVTPQILALRSANADVVLHTVSAPKDAGTFVVNLREVKWTPTIVSMMFGQSTGQLMAVSGPESFTSGKYWGLVPKAFTYCSSEKVGSRAYDRYLAKLKAFNPGNFEKIDHKVSLYVYDPIFVWKAAVEGAKSLNGDAIVGWLEKNGSTLKSAGTGYPLSASPTNHFFLGPDSVTFVNRPDLIRKEDNLIERKFGC
jgi:ABC-type branched-subunit amino acid transport system substrate-binding protein